MKTIHVAIVGLGYWGPNLVRNFLKIPGVRISFLCDINPKMLKKMNEQYPLISTTIEYQKLLNDPNTDLIAIATPLSTHFTLAQKALTAHKNVYIEKPMTKNSKEARELIRLAKRQKKMLMVGHTFIYSSEVQMIKEYITKKNLGELYYYDSTRINLGGFQSDTNVLWDLASHDLAILDYIFNEKILSLFVVPSKHSNAKQIEVAHLFFRYSNNISAHIHASWLSPVKMRTIFIAGNKKMIVYNDIEPSEKIKIYHHDVTSLTQVSPFSPAYRSGDIVIPKLSQQETLYSQLLHAIDCIRSKKKPLSDGAQGLRVVTLLEAAEESISTHKEIFFHD